jgi:uncharacterized protein (DUF433 family)
MNHDYADNPVIVETSHGPSIKGTPLTIFHIMEMLKAGRSFDYIEGWRPFTSEDMVVVKQYLKENEEELERRYASEYLNGRQNWYESDSADPRRESVIEVPAGEPAVVQTSRGPSINGTRITVYTILELLHTSSPDYVQGLYRLSDEAWAGVMKYIGENREELERELAEIIQRSEEERRYWTERNKDRINRPPSPPANEKIALGRARLAAIKAERRQREECKSS